MPPGGGFGAAPNRATPQNPKYANTASKLNTGNNMGKVLAKHQGAPQYAHQRPKDEFFVRLKPSVLGRLLEPLVESEESIYALANEDARSVATSVVPNSAAGGSSDGNIVIFDLRPFEEYEQCHVFGAIHLDVEMLKRSTNNMPHQIFKFKGPVECDKMVVLYDEDGKIASKFGNTFVERGVENTYVVSGGFLALCATAPHVLMGHPPSVQTLATLMQRAGIKVGASSARSDAGRCTERCSTAGSVRTQNTNVTSSAAGSPGRPWK